MTDELVRHTDGTFHWEGVEVLKYKEGAAPPSAALRTGFKDVTRQVLFQDNGLPCQLRYFEVAPGGWTSLERHEHVHAVMVIRGRGQCLVGEKAYEIDLHDLVSVPPMTWHQFHAAADQPLGFLCMVTTERDRPQLPAEAEVEAIAKPLKR